MKSVFVLLGIVLIILTVKSVEISAHGHGEHKSSCPDCKGQDNEYSFVGDHNNVNKYHEDDKNPEHHGHRDSAENHGHSHHNHDFIENHGHGHRNRHH